MSSEIHEMVPVPADVERPDKILAGLTARQTAIASAAAVAIWAGYHAAAGLLPLPAFAAIAAPLAIAALALVIGERDGLPLDRLLAAAWRQARAPKVLAHAPDGIAAPPGWAVPPGPLPPSPAPWPPLWRAVTADGTISLGPGGAAACCAVSTVNLALRTAEEQDALAAGYGRWLNSLTGPAQILIRAGRANLAAAITRLRDAAPALPHPALEACALEHARFLEDLAADRDVLTRQALLIVREPAARPGGSAPARAAQRAAEASRLLASAGVTATVMSGGQVTALLAASADPGAPPVTGPLAMPGQPVTAARQR